MNEKPDQLIVSASKHHCNPETWSEYHRHSSEFLTELRQLDPIFGTLAVLRDGELFSIPSESPLPAELIALAAYDPDHPDRYMNLGRSNALESQSLCRIGFSVSYYSFDQSRSDMRFLPRDHGGIELTLQGCSASLEPKGQAILKLPTHRYTRLHSRHLVTKVLQLMFEVWGCTGGRVRSMNFEKVVNAGKVASYSGQWLLYVPWPDLRSCLPSDVLIEPFHGGVLIASTAEPPSIHRPEDVEAGFKLARILDDLGLATYSEYVFEGWPPDAEEWRYEEFISGAPPGRKYRVHCVDFDGFDADRNVLLFAKLFRRLKKHPKPWGLRGWDGPVLNEAKRQVNAARKAGGVPIEWHIGLEEPAERTRELIADYTEISDKQLKVIYTPMELDQG